MTEIPALFPLISMPPFYMQQREVVLFVVGRPADIFLDSSSSSGFFVSLSPEFSSDCPCKGQGWGGCYLHDIFNTSLQSLFLPISYPFPSHFFPFKKICQGAWGEWKWFCSACVFQQRVLQKEHLQSLMCIVTCMLSVFSLQQTHNMYFVLYSYIHSYIIFLYSFKCKCLVKRT